MSQNQKRLAQTKISPRFAANVDVKLFVPFHAVHILDHPNFVPFRLCASNICLEHPSFN